MWWPLVILSVVGFVAGVLCVPKDALIRRGGVLRICWAAFFWYIFTFPTLGDPEKTLSAFLILGVAIWILSVIGVVWMRTDQFDSADGAERNPDKIAVWVSVALPGFTLVVLEGIFWDWLVSKRKF